MAVANEVDADIGSVRPVGGWAQVDHGRVAVGLKLGQPGDAPAQPLHLIADPVGDGLLAVQLDVLVGVRVFQGRPAGCPQLTRAAASASTWAAAGGGSPSPRLLSYDIRWSIFVDGYSQQEPL